MNKERIMQYIIYGSILFIVISVGKSMFGTEDTVRNVPQNVSHETSSTTNTSTPTKDEEKLAFERKNQQQVNTLKDLYDEQTIMQSKGLAKQFAIWAFPFGEMREISEVEGFVKKEVYETVLSGRVTNASASRTLTSYEIYEAYDQGEEIHWVVRLTGNVRNHKKQQIETVVYDYHIYLMREQNRLWITKFNPQKVS